MRRGLVQRVQSVRGVVEKTEKESKALARWL